MVSREDKFYINFDEVLLKVKIGAGEAAISRHTPTGIPLTKFHVESCRSLENVEIEDGGETADRRPGRPTDAFWESFERSLAVKYTKL